MLILKLENVDQYRADAYNLTLQAGWGEKLVCDLPTLPVKGNLRFKQRQIESVHVAEERDVPGLRLLQHWI